MVLRELRYLTIILRNRAEYHLILSRRGRRPSWLNQGIFRKIEQDNCFIIQQILINYHFHNEKNYGSMHDEIYRDLESQTPADVRLFNRRTSAGELCRK